LTATLSRPPGFRGSLALWLGLSLLAGCGGSQEESRGEKIECRLATSAIFERICTIEHVDSPDGRVIVARRPDGGFRRLLIVGDGRGVIAADGAEPVTVRASRVAGHIEVSAGDMVYRLPAKVAP
jgi:hypothetical protein